GVAMPPARPHAEPAHRTAKTTSTNELGPARTIAFKPAPPPPMMTRARAAAIQRAAATPHPLTPTGTMATRPRTHPDRTATPTRDANPPAELPASRPLAPMLARKPANAPTPAPSVDPMCGVQPTPGGRKRKQPATAPAPHAPVPTQGKPTCLPPPIDVDLLADIKEATTDHHLPFPHPPLNPTLASTSTVPVGPTMDPYDHFDDDRDHHRRRQAAKEARQRPLKSTKPTHVRRFQQDLENLAERFVEEVNGDRRAPFRTRDEMIAEIVGPQLFRGRGRPLFDANRPAFDTWESAMRRLATYASDGLTPAESLQRVRRFRWHPRRRTPIDAMTQLQLLSAACGTTIPLSELKHLFVTGCLDPRTARRLQNVRYAVNGIDLPWNDDRVTLELLAERALLETAASGHSANHDDDSSSSSSSSSSTDTTTSESSSSSDEDHHRRRRRNRKEKRRASSRRRRQSSSRRRRDHRSPSTDRRRRQSRDRRALESGRPSTSRGSTSTAAVDTAYPAQLVEAMETILAMHSPAG
ncbi:hypothetical protein HDU96_004216, partial [Phlyctochytrium bullatum]